jgi:serine/threonine protein kinase
MASESLNALLEQRGYKIVGQLGKGSFGVVFKVSGSGGEYALKQIKDASNLHIALEREIGLLKMMDHPSIVRLTDVFADRSSNSVFIAMELVQGGSLMAHLLQAPQNFTEALARPLMYHIACALGFAHASGVMHRDLKPENILLTREWVPKICDFGFARKVNSSELCISRAGSPGYVAPEVHMQMPYFFPADVFSCGLVFCDILSEKYVCHWGLKNFPPSVQEQLRKRWPQDAKPPRKSIRLQQLEQRMLCQVPGERIAMVDVCSELAKLAKEEPMPCQLWQLPTKVPSGRPPQGAGLSPENAADLAGRFGIAVGSPVLVNAAGAWKKGVVEHISTSACPGAAQVRVDRTAMLVCPWQFQTLLRPDTEPSPGQQPNPLTQSLATVTDPVPPPPQAKGKGKGYEKGGKSRREVPEANASSGKKCGIFPTGMLDFLRKK